MSKRCKNCNKLNPYPLNKFCSHECKKALGIEYFTKPQKELKKTPLKTTRKAIKPISKKSKNNIAKFSSKTKQEILERDKVCIISGEPITDYHHSFYGAINVNYGDDRNASYEGVGLANRIHYIIHHGLDTILAKKYKLICIEYSVRMRLKHKDK